MLESFKLAFQSMLGNKMRTFLTMLGIVIGVASVITLLSIVNGSTRQIMGQFSDIGANQISVNLVQMDTRRVTEEDMYKFYDANRALFSEITPNMMIDGGIKYGKEKLKSTNISGVSEQYALIKSYKMAYGRFISYTDIAYRQKVAVVGYYVASKLFKEPKQAVGEKINIKGDMYEIVGVIAKRDENAMSKGGTDDVACVPYSTAIKAMKAGIPSMYTLTTSDTKNTQQALTALQDMLMEVYQNKDFFTVNAMAELLKQLNSMVATMSVMLGGIAGISLLVAGVGVMNIMLVSVTERTKEIGIRKALGARKSVIMQQFVIEALLTTTIGGVIGIILGTLVSIFIGPMMNMDATPALSSIIISFSVSVSIGLIFGYMPAARAAGLNPIDALRNE